MSAKTQLLIALTCAVVLSACGGDGGSDGPSAPGSGALDDAGTGGERVSPFPPARPPVDPMSNITEIEELAESVLIAYDEVMIEVFRQVNDVVRTIESGVESSSDPDVLARDAKLYERIADEFCLTARDRNGDINSLLGCSGAPLAFRHPTYDDILVSVEDS